MDEVVKYTVIDNLHSKNNRIWSVHIYLTIHQVLAQLD